MWTNFIVFNFWTIFFVFFNSSWSNLLQILLGWIRIRIYKAAGSGSALRWTVGSGLAKNECGSTALNTTMNLTHKKWKYSVALTDNQSGTTFNTTVLYCTSNYGSVTSRDVKLFRQVLFSFCLMLVGFSFAIILCGSGSSFRSQYGIGIFQYGSWVPMNWIKSLKNCCF